MTGKILFAWLGNTDLKAAEEDGKAGFGPVAEAVKEKKFSYVRLLCNYGKRKSGGYVKWFRTLFPDTDISVIQSDITTPMDFSGIYESAVKILERERKRNSNAEFVFHISPGTPAMAAIWIILANSRFPARLIESSRDFGVKDVVFPFDIAADYIPRLNRELGEKIIGFAYPLPPDTPEFEMILYRSREMADAVERAKRAAMFDVPVLLLGESGTGKEMFARAVHSVSRQSEGPFVPVNCGAIPSTLVESELFGYEKGAFTGAAEEKRGIIETADGGTLFLDEIGELPEDVQVKLLRALQEGEVYRIGSVKPVKSDFRVIAATNRDLISDVQKGDFREDLFHRIAVGVIHLPALRNRKSDLNLLIDHFLNEINREFRGQKGWINRKLSVSARRVLTRYSWPGNVRELINTLMRISIWSRGDTISKSDAQAALFGDSSARTDSILNRSLGEGFDINELLSEVALHYIDRALEEAGGSKLKAAELLGFKNYQTLSNWMKRFGR